MEAEVDAYLRRKYTTAIRDVETVFREDLDLKNHLSGLKRKLLMVRSQHSCLPATHQTCMGAQCVQLPRCCQDCSDGLAFHEC
jgi:hypothetical protein